MNNIGGTRQRSAGHWRPISAVVVILLMITAIVTINTLQSEGQSGSTANAADASAIPVGGVTRYGVLGGSCDADRVGHLRAAGVQLVELIVDWNQFEPAPQVYDTDYIGGLRDQISRCRAAGLALVLSPGFQYAPAWVGALPNGTYRNQHGGSGPANVPNLIFSAAVRDAVAAYLTRFAREFPLNQFFAIRLGTSESGELGYPGRAFGAPNPGNNFWAFDAAAQSRQGLAAGIDPSPMPGWVPGAWSFDNRPVTDADARAWFHWYTDSAGRAILWEINQARALGYHGAVHLPLAGRGVLPADLDHATAAGLNGTADRDGSLERGLFYPDQIATIAAGTHGASSTPSDAVAIDVTGLDDATAVTARHLDPAQDGCQAADAQSDLRTNAAVENWSASRWTIANARANHLSVVGENPGPPSTPGTGGDEGSDSLPQQLIHAPAYASECGLDVLMWAFEDDLFGAASGVSVQDYARRIAQ